MQDAQFRATQGAILEHEIAGIDILTGGEMHRRTNNRYAPPNAMLNFFWNKMPGFSDEVKHKKITPQDENVTHPAAICNGKIQDADLGLLDEFETVSRYTRDGEVKITMTGPHMLAKVAWDEHYNDLKAMMQDIAKVINSNFKKLQQNGCQHVQIDEPLFALADNEEVQNAIEAINMCFEDIDMNKFTHICQGNYAVGEDYDGQIGHRYSTGDYPADLITDINADVFLVEYDMVDEYEPHLGDQQQIAVGAVDVQDFEVEDPDTLIQRIEAYDWLDAEHTLITSTCGMNHVPSDVAFGKLVAMADASRKLRKQPAGV